jgi:hypothetical protein
MWSDNESLFYKVPGSYLVNGLTATGPIAIAQGGGHEGILAQESGSSTQSGANIITAFRLKFPFDGINPFDKWITCGLPKIKSTDTYPFQQGGDPHTVTAYQSPTRDIDGTYHSFAVLANRTPADTIAVVDLDLMLKIVPPLGTNVCPGGVPAGTPGILPANVVSFVPVCSPSPSCQK